MLVWEGENTGGHITITAQDIQITEARTTDKSRLEEKSHQSGISVGAGGAVMEAAQSIGNTIEATENTKDQRMKNLGIAAAGMQIYSAVSGAGQSKGTDPAAATGSEEPVSLSINITLGSSSSESVTERQADRARGSSLNAGGDVQLIASGAGKASDILVQGSHVQAGETVRMKAEGDIRLQAAENTAQEHYRSESSSASVSVGYGVGGWTFSASAQSAKGAGSGEELSLETALL